MSRTYRREERPPWSRPSNRRREDTFRCLHCKLLVGAVPSGGNNRNHCPYCLHSRHVDGRRPGDRANGCGGRMMPVAVFTRPKGEHVLVHRCLSCGDERYNRIAADDDFDLVLALPMVPQPRSSKAGRSRPAEPDRYAV